MKTEPALSMAAQHYEKAYAQHYMEHDLLAALRSYAQVMALHPEAPEAGYARARILGIVDACVPAGELMAVQTELAIRHLASGVEMTAASSR